MVTMPMETHQPLAAVGPTSSERKPTPENRTWSMNCRRTRMRRCPASLPGDQLRLIRQLPTVGSGLARRPTGQACRCGALGGRIRAAKRGRRTTATGPAVGPSQLPAGSITQDPIPGCSRPLPSRRPGSSTPPWPGLAPSFRPLPGRRTGHRRPEFDPPTGRRSLGRGAGSEHLHPPVTRAGQPTAVTRRSHLVAGTVVRPAVAVLEVDRTAVLR